MIKKILIILILLSIFSYCYAEDLELPGGDVDQEAINQSIAQKEAQLRMQQLAGIDAKMVELNENQIMIANQLYAQMDSRLSEMYSFTLATLIFINLATIGIFYAILLRLKATRRF